MRLRIISFVVLLSAVCLIIPHNLSLQLYSKQIPSEGTTRRPNLTWLHTDGRLVKNEAGETVFLRGAGFMDLAAMSGWHTPGIQYHIELINELVGFDKCNIFRCAMTAGIHHSPPSWIPGEVHPEVYDDAVDELVTLAKQYGFYVVLEFHGGLHLAGNFVGQSGYIWENEAQRLANDPTDLVNWWMHWANKYKNEPYVVGYEIYNEPAFPDGKWYTVVAPAIVGNITSMNPNALIIVGSDPWESIGQYWLDNPLQYNNVIYSIDTYYAHWNDWNKEPYWNGDFETGYSRMQYNFAVGSRLYEASNKGMVLFNTEFGFNGDKGVLGTHTYEGPNWQEAMRDYLSIMNDFGMGWYIWYWRPISETHHGFYNETTLQLTEYGEIWKEYSVRTQPSQPKPDITLGNTTIFEDSFENGTFSAWTGTVGIPQVASTQAHLGTCSMTCDKSDEYAYKIFKSQPTVFVRFCFMLSELPPLDNWGIRLLQLEGTSGSPMRIADLSYHHKDGRYRFQFCQNYPNQTWNYYEITLSPNTWYSAEIEFVKDNVNGEFRFWFNGLEVISVTGLNTSNAPDANMIAVGASKLFYNATAWIDDVAMNSSYIGS